jgi:aldehyde:ferredoxin oxidoreductase
MKPLTFRMLNVDLSTGRAEPRELGPEVVRDFLGGASLVAHLLYGSLIPGLDPFDEAAPLVFAAGPLTGTTGPAVGRYVICARSPATGLWGESNAGGFFGPELRAAGIDVLKVTGCAQSPAYLWIDDGKVEMLPAGDLWGVADTYETQAAIRAVHGSGVRVASIGLAGEARLPMALVLCDHGRVAGRSGMGAVMGSKNLKAVAVRGSQAIPLADCRGFEVARSAANLALRRDSVTSAMHQLGSASGGDYFDYLGTMPKRYFTRGTFDGTGKVSGSTMASTILSGVSTCQGCVIACGRKVRLLDGRERKGPEYETLVGFGPNLEIDDMTAIVRMGELCDRYGLDSISLSNTLGLAFLLSQEGLLDQEIDGQPLTWGNAAAAEHLIHLTARRKGLGELIGQGARALARRYGVESWAAQVNGLEVAYHDPRGASGMALVYATSPRGACHNQSDYFMVDIGQTIELVGVERFYRHAGAEKAANVARHQDWRTVGNALVICHFANVDPASELELVNRAGGFDLDMAGLMRAGERGWTLKRAINHRLGLSARNDHLPEHLLKPLPDGGAAGYVPPFDEMMEAYYQARDWDPESGRPRPAKLRQLGLDQVLADLWHQPAA